MTADERRRKQREVLEAFSRLSSDNRDKLLRYAEHLAEHKMLSHAYMGQDNPEPCCVLTCLN
jgi:hypothetical protein